MQMPARCEQGAMLSLSDSVLEADSVCLLTFDALPKPHKFLHKCVLRLVVCAPVSALRANLLCRACPATLSAGLVRHGRYSEGGEAGPNPNPNPNLQLHARLLQTRLGVKYYLE